MSAYREIQTEFTDQECLCEALQEMGYKPVVSEQPQQLEGYEAKRRKEKAEIIIPRRQVGGAANDVGFARQSDGKFKAIISEYDGGVNFGTKRMEQLKQTYAEKKSVKIAKTQGLRMQARKIIPNTDGTHKVQYVYTQA